MNGLEKLVVYIWEVVSLLRKVFFHNIAWEGVFCLFWFSVFPRATIIEQNKNGAQLDQITGETMQANVHLGLQFWKLHQLK